MTEYNCSFCGKSEDEVEIIVAANDKYKLAICNECVDVCVGAIKTKRADVEPSIKIDLTPNESEENAT